MKRLIVLCTMVGVIGCGGTDGAEGPCSSRSGLYKVKYTAKSGNCGAVPEYVFNTEDPDEDGGCMGMETVSDDMCVETADLVCTRDDGAAVTIRAKSTWNAESTKATGTMYVRIETATDRCSGVYGITIAPL